MPKLFTRTFTFEMRLGLGFTVFGQLMILYTHWIWAKIAVGLEARISANTPN
jgi:hypothetical protein